MGTTSEIVGPSECVQAQAVARPMSLKLETQFVRETKGHADFSAMITTLTGRLCSRLRLGLLIFGVVTSCVPLNAVEDTYTVESERSPKVDYYYQEKNRQAASERQEQFRKRVSIQHAVGENVPHAFVRSPVASSKQITAQPRSDADSILLQGILLIIAMILTVMLAVRILAPDFFTAVIKKLKPWAANANAAAGITAWPAAGDDDLNFYAVAARLITTQRALLLNITRATEDLARHRMLADLRREMSAFKSEATSPDFLPAWQVASALEGLLKQLSDKVGNATQSTLRTVASALDLLEQLSKPGVRRDIMTHPPLRFLAVDDDMISRTAVSLALKKVFNQPDLADNGDAAFGLATKNLYDVIFLDVQMSGMDGYELC